MFYLEKPAAGAKNRIMDLIFKFTLLISSISARILPKQKFQNHQVVVKSAIIMAKFATSISNVTKFATIVAKKNTGGDVPASRWGQNASF